MDFVAKKRDALIYIQVSDNISDETTFEREYSPLLAIRDAYPKMVIARTHHETYDYQGGAGGRYLQMAVMQIDKFQLRMLAR